MTHITSSRSQGRKISQFPADSLLPSDAALTFISGGTNYKITLQNFLNSLNVTGSIESTGTGIPVLNTVGTTNYIRSIIAGPGATVDTDLYDNVIVSFTEPVEITGTYTITGTNEVVICSGSSDFTVTLPANPSVGDQATIFYIGSGSTITVDRNGNTINGGTTNPTFTDTFSTQTYMAYSSGWVITNEILQVAKTTVINSGYTITGSEEVVICAGSSNYTVGLPTVHAIGDTAILFLTGSATAISIDLNGSTLNGGTTGATLSTLYGSISLRSVSTTAWVTENEMPVSIPSLLRPVVNVTTTYTVVDLNAIYLCATGTYTITLPSTLTVSDNLTFVKLVTTGTVTLELSGASVDGSTTNPTLTTAWDVENLLAATTTDWVSLL